jgi:hypothetical protein
MVIAIKFLSWLSYHTTACGIDDCCPVTSTITYDFAFLLVTPQSTLSMSKRVGQLNYKDLYLSESGGGIVAGACPFGICHPRPSVERLA